MFRLKLVVTMLLLWLNAMAWTSQSDAQPTITPVQVGWTHSGPLLPDSSNFVTASLLVITPGERIYSTPGHCAIRLECPMHNLDYCYSMETGVRWTDFMSFYSGRLKAKFFAFETSMYLGAYASEKRGVTQYELNLTPHEKQRLWQLLDENMMQDVEITYNLLKDNCISKGILTIEDALIDERLEFGEMPEIMYKINGQLARYVARRAPWVEFLYTSFLGTECDNFWDIEYRLSPELVAEILQKSQFVSNSDEFKRPVLIASKQLLAQQASERQYAITPTIAFALVLLLVTLISLYEIKYGPCLVGRCCNVVLLVIQTAASLFLLYLTVYSGLFGYHWNWYLIPCNPLPALLWLCFRHREWWPKIYLVYTIILLCFLAMTPISEQIDLPHQLITATLAVRCATIWFLTKRHES